MAVFSLNCSDFNVEELESFSGKMEDWPFSFELCGESLHENRIVDFAKHVPLSGLVHPFEESALSMLDQLSIDQYEEFKNSAFIAIENALNEGISFFVIKGAFNMEMTSAFQDVNKRLVEFFRFLIYSFPQAEFFLPVSLSSMENSPELYQQVFYLHNLINHPSLKFRLTLPFPYDLSQFNKLDRQLAFKCRQIRLLLPAGFEKERLFKMIRELKNTNYLGKLVFSADEPSLEAIEQLIDEVSGLYKS